MGCDEGEESLRRASGGSLSECPVDGLLVGGDGLLQHVRVGPAALLLEVDRPHGILLMCGEIGRGHLGLVVELEQRVLLPVAQPRHGHRQVHRHRSRPGVGEDADLRGLVVNTGLHPHGQTLVRLIHDSGVGNAVISHGATATTTTTTTTATTTTRLGQCVYGSCLRIGVFAGADEALGSIAEEIM